MLNIKMGFKLLTQIFIVIFMLFNCSDSTDILGCGGFIKSHAPIDFSKIEVKLYTKQGTLKDNAFCAPNNGYYFIPLYDKGEYVLKINPPPGWSFKPKEVELNVNGETDICTKGGDINFVFEGFGITGKVDAMGGGPGPAGIQIKLIDGSKVSVTKTTAGGDFYFTPVYPGTYILHASHPKWIFKKDSVEVQVKTGNTEIPKDSLLIAGYEVNGTVVFENKPLEKVYFILYNAANSPLHIEGCSTDDIINYTSKEKMLCHVQSNKQGAFVFPSLSSGQYLLEPFFEEENVKYHMTPPEMRFNVTATSLELKPTFVVTNFSVRGHVFTHVDGKSVPGALIFLDNEQVTTTKQDGSFVLGQLTTGTYSLKIEAPGLQFDLETLKLSSSVVIKSEYYPTAFQVCGNIASENSHKVMFKNLEAKANADDSYTIQTETANGDFCIYLPPGRYSASVLVPSKDKSKGIRFFPVEHVFNLTDQPQMGLFFSKLKASVKGLVKCIRPKDCQNINVIFVLQGNQDIEDVKYVVPLETSGSYYLPDVIPGTYVVSLENNNYCWEKKEHFITLTTEKTEVPDFKQTGYVIMFNVSHETEMEYFMKSNVSELKPSITLFKNGLNKICVDKAGTYHFTQNSCHIFDQNTVTYDTDSDSEIVNLVAKKHLMSFDIRGEAPVDDLTVNIKVDDIIHQGPLEYAVDGDIYWYRVKIHLAKHESAYVTPQSGTLWFTPDHYKIFGSKDCVDEGERMRGHIGLIVQGKIIPALETVDISLIRNDGQTFVTQSDAQGKYRFPAVDPSYGYQLQAAKESYTFSGPDKDRNFIAYKLAKIIAKVVDKEDGKPLQGALISLSGAETYRANLLTNKDGMITFSSLSPSSYFLRPVMKEYEFDPPSKMITIREGTTINVELSGKRVAFSAYGLVTSLTDDPEKSVSVIATGVNECSTHGEEATSDQNGQFRIRGLQPGCVYHVAVGDGSDSPAANVKLSLPTFVPIQIEHEDVRDIRLMSLQSVATTDIVVHIISSDPENFKNVKLKLFRENNPLSPIYLTKLDPGLYRTQKLNNPGVLVHLPELPIDNKEYFFKLEATSQFSQIYSSPPYYFITNSSFICFTVKYEPEDVYPDEDMGQLSYTTIFIVLCFIVYYKFNTIVNGIARLLYRVKFGGFLPKIPLPVEEPLNDDDIDELVENINAPRKKSKVRRA